MVDRDAWRRMAIARLAAAVAVVACVGTATAQTTSTTTLACAAEPTVPSVQCRLGLLAAQLAARDGAAPLNHQLTNQVQRAIRAADEAATASGKRAATMLKRVRGPLTSFTQRLKSLTGRRKIEPDVRRALLDLAAPLLADVKQLARAL